MRRPRYSQIVSLGERIDVQWGHELWMYAEALWVCQRASEWQKCGVHEGWLCYEAIFKREST